MGKTFATIYKKEMDNFLNSKDFKEVKVKNTAEAVYDRPFTLKDGKASSLVIRVYSSIEGDVNRSCGADAIRVCLFDTGLNRGVGRAEKRVNRVNGWDNRLLERLREVYLSAAKLTKCPHCNSYMVERKSKLGGEFLGCTRYPLCKGTREIVELK